jgi:hypothetical protein
MFLQLELCRASFPSFRCHSRNSSASPSCSGHVMRHFSHLVFSDMIFLLQYPTRKADVPGYHQLCLMLDSGYDMARRNFQYHCRTAQLNNYILILSLDITQNIVIRASKTPSGAELRVFKYWIVPGDGILPERMIYKADRMRNWNHFLQTPVRLGSRSFYRLFLFTVRPAFFDSASAFKGKLERARFLHLSAAAPNTGSDYLIEHLDWNGADA